MKKIAAITVVMAFGFFALSVPYVRAYCGDRIVDTEFGEACDDGNFMNGDGCNSYCLLEDLTSPTVVSVSIPNETQEVSTATRTLDIMFSEPIDPLTVIKTNISLEVEAKPLPVELRVSEDQTVVTLILQDFLMSQARHALHIKAIRDLNGNLMQKEWISVFDTAVHIDKTPPFITADPPEEAYHFAQRVTLKAYQSEKETGPGFEDPTVKIYYTLDGSTPTTQSFFYETPLTFSKPTLLRFFGVDGSSNYSRVMTAKYSFECPAFPHAKTVTGYPTCNVEECEKGFKLLNNACVNEFQLTVSGPETNYKEGAITAPLFSSDTPLTISTKPALYLNAEHEGTIRRPLIFRNLKRESEIHFEKNTRLTKPDGTPFMGYLLTPTNRYLKEFPVNFGYAFKAIVEFKAAESEKIVFTPSYTLSITLQEALRERDFKIFTFNESTEQYIPYDSTRVALENEGKTVVIEADKTGLFFVSEKGTGFTKAVFTDMENHWAKNYAEALYRRGIVKGRDKGVFAPDELLNRAEFVKVALESLGTKIPSVDDLKEKPFPDVSVYAWYAPYLAKAKELTLIKGYPDGNFRPEQSVNRAEAIHILMKAFKFDLSEAGGFKSESGLPDIESGEWYYPAMNFAVYHNLLDGIRDKRGFILHFFGPDKPITRGEMAKLALKAIELSEEKKN